MIGRELFSRLVFGCSGSLSAVLFRWWCQRYILHFEESMDKVPFLSSIKWHERFFRTFPWYNKYASWKEILFNKKNEANTQCRQAVFSLGWVVPCTKMIKLVINEMKLLLLTVLISTCERRILNFGKRVNFMDKASQNYVPHGNLDPVWLYFVQMFSWTIANSVACFPSCGLLSFNELCV